MENLKDLIIRLQNLESRMKESAVVMMLTDNPEIKGHGNELSGAAGILSGWIDGISDNEE